MKKSLLTIFLVVFIYHTGQSQNSVNLNSGHPVKYEESQGSKSNDLTLKDSKRFRKILLNPILQSSDQINVKDTILLDLFADKKYKAIIEKTGKDVNGTFVIRARLDGFKYNYCIVSTNNGRSLMTLEIPENKEFYKLKYDHKANTHLLLQIDESKTEYLEGAPSLIPPEDEVGQNSLKKK